MASINIIGAGQVGSTLGYLLTHDAACAVHAVLDKQTSSAQRAIELMGQGQIVTDYAQLPEADITLVTVNDDQIAQVVLALSQHEQRRGVVLHCSGSLSSDVLLPLRKENLTIASAHPIKSFVAFNASIATFAGTTVTLEGDEVAIKLLTPLLTKIGAHPVRIDPGVKATYHAGLVMACGHMVTLLEASVKCLTHAGIDAKTALSVLIPFVRDTLDQVSIRGPEASLTGPVPRADADTLREQLAKLEAWSPSIAKLYRDVSERTLTVANLSPAEQRRLQEQVFDAIVPADQH